jgi:amino acid transporter
MFTIARLLHAAGNEGSLPSMFAELHPKFMTPIKALIFQGAICSVMIMLGNLNGLVVFNGIVEWTWYLVSHPEYLSTADIDHGNGGGYLENQGTEFE